MPGGSDTPGQPERRLKTPERQSELVGGYWARQGGSKAGVGLSGTRVGLSYLQLVDCCPATSRRTVTPSSFESWSGLVSALFLNLVMNSYAFRSKGRDCHSGPDILSLVVNSNDPLRVLFGGPQGSKCNWEDQGEGSLLVASGTVITLSRNAPGERGQGQEPPFGNWDRAK